MLRFFRSLRRAGRGLTLVAHEPNFRLEAIAGAIVLLAAFALQVSPLAMAILVVSVALLLVLEAVNTMVEKLADLVEPKLNHYVAHIKDAAAAAVLIAAASATVATLLVLGPAVANRWLANGVGFVV